MQAAKRKLSKVFKKKKPEEGVRSDKGKGKKLEHGGTASVSTHVDQPTPIRNDDISSYIPPTPIRNDANVVITSPAPAPTLFGTANRPPSQGPPFTRPAAPPPAPTPLAPHEVRNRFITPTTGGIQGDLFARSEAGKGRSNPFHDFPFVVTLSETGDPVSPSGRNDQRVVSPDLETEVIVEQKPLKPPKPFPQLPVEVWTGIIENLTEDDGSLYPLLLVSSGFYREVARVLYRIIDITGDRMSQFERQIRLFELLAEQPQRAMLVESFSMPWLLSHSKRGTGDLAYGAHREALKRALRAMINLRSLSILPQDGANVPLDVKLLLSGCTFPLRTLEIAEVGGLNISLLEPYAAELEELTVKGEKNRDFNGSCFPKLQVLSLPDWDQPILDHLAGSQVKALWWWCKQPGLHVGTAFLPLRSLTLSIDHRTVDLTPLSRAFPSVRYLSLVFLRVVVAASNFLPSGLRDLRELRFLNIVRPPQQWRTPENRKLVSQQTLEGVLSLQCVCIDVEMFWRGERQRLSMLDLWKNDRWWK